MSQSATLYRISQDNFNRLAGADNQLQFNSHFAKSYCTFQGSFMALEYLLAEGLDKSTIELLNQIFYPRQTLGNQDAEDQTPEQQFDFYENEFIIPYLNPEIISKLNKILAEISVENMRSKYDSAELNDKGIYPEIWHDDNSPNQAFNERHILQDFEALKTIINQADAEQDYIFVFIG